MAEPDSLDWNWWMPSWLAKYLEIADYGVQARLARLKTLPFALLCQVWRYSMSAWMGNHHPQWQNSTEFRLKEVRFWSASRGTKPALKECHLLNIRCLSLELHSGSRTLPLVWIPQTLGLRQNSQSRKVAFLQCCLLRRPGPRLGRRLGSDCLQWWWCASICPSREQRWKDQTCR